MRVLQVAVAAFLPSQGAELLVSLEPRIRLDHRPELLPPMRHPADFAGDPSFRRNATEEVAFEAMLNHADALFGIPDMDPDALRRVVRSNRELRWVHTMAAGGGAQVKAAGLSAIELERVAFTTSAGVHGAPLAEFAMLGLLAGAKDIPRLYADKANHNWPERRMMGQLADQSILVLGLGGIGAEVARLAKSFGAHVVGASRRRRSTSHVDEQISIEDLHDAASCIDALVVALPGTRATEKLIGDAFFANARAGLTIVNVGRGTVIDEPALIAALDSGVVGYAALDVAAVEPLPADSPLWAHDRVLLSPHTAALSIHEEERIVRLFAENATRLLDGEPLRNRVDIVEFY